MSNSVLLVLMASIVLGQGWVITLYNINSFFALTAEQAINISWLIHGHLS